MLDNFRHIKWDAFQHLPGNLYLPTCDQGKKYFEKAVELKNTDPDFQYNLAFCYKKLNKTKQAMRHLEFYHKLMETR